MTFLANNRQLITVAAGGHPHYLSRGDNSDHLRASIEVLPRPRVALLESRFGVTAGKLRLPFS
jgi:hypothetical protein